MKLNSLLLVSSLCASSAFVLPQKGSRSTNSGTAVRAFEDADSLLDKLSKADSTSFAAPPPPPPAAVVVTPPPVLQSAPIPTPMEAVAPNTAAVVEKVTSSAGGGADMTSLGGDLPIVPIAVGALVVIALVAALSGGDDDAMTTSSTAGSGDLSIPYDAAARLAYEKAGSPGDYEAFKAKYEADAVAEVKAKQKK